MTLFASHSCLHVYASEKRSVDEKVDPDLIDFRPPTNKARTLTRASGTRFKAPTPDEQMTTLGKVFVPQNTQKNTTWAVRIFREWRQC